MAQRVSVQFERRHAGAVIPQYANAEDSGADLFSVEMVYLGPGERAVVETGIAIKLPPGYEAQVRPKSGRAAKEGLTVLNTPGTVDNGYRGTIKVILLNTDTQWHTVKIGEKIAQLVVAPYVQADFEEVSSLDETDRGTGGIGSTGLGHYPPPDSPGSIFRSSPIDSGLTASGYPMMDIQAPTDFPGR